MTVLRATESFTCPDGSVGTGDMIDSSDPIVKGREHLFTDVVPSRSDVLATANPEVDAEMAEAEQAKAEAQDETAEAEKAEEAPAGGLKTTSVPRRRRK